MDFKTATDELFHCATHAELAARIGCSVAAIRQARLDPSAKAYRNPPPGWEAAVRALAADRSKNLARLAKP